MHDANESSIAVVTRHVQLARDIGLWRSSILPLAIRQSIALFPMAGIPDAMCERPVALLKTARHLIARIDDDMRLGTVTFDPGRGWIDDEATSAVAIDVELAIKKLGDAYGEVPAAELTLWLIRNEVDWAVRERWWAWRLFFGSITSERLQMPETLAASGRARGLIESLLGRDAREALRACVDAALAIPHSPHEARLLAFEKQAVSEGDQEALDVVVALKLAAEREAARHLYLALRHVLDAGEWTELMRFVAPHLPEEPSELAVSR